MTTTVVRPNPNTQMVKPEPTLEAQVSDVEWRTALVDESRAYEIFPALRRARLIAAYLGPTVTLAPTTEPEVQP